MDAHTPLLILQCVMGHEPVTFSPLQQTLMAHIAFFQYVWWGIWIATAMYLLSKLIRYKT